ncbi:ABC transporter ATP-binding protein [Fodinicurvata fenggangensis]|uniref:ABC transporter ATP-binding protein n=1 Tax=Fodinicurvata fenggangensis TaxID=1121830 RepID=UPI00047B873B|nr:ABC transporter ATP-binding protein [Fodinicurvata fenggangensis]
MSEEAATAVELSGVVKRYGTLTAVQSTDLKIPEGSFVTLLGPSGCGKTTTLRMIAGLASITEGEIRIKDRRINEIPIHKRNLGLVFQNYALFPHKSVWDNVAFGLRYRKTSREEVSKRVAEALELVKLGEMGERMPAQLSGGQQQRIALARAIVIQPDVLLLDEPLSALDANLREDMRVELKRIQDQLGITTIFVTHDQSEALAMSDHIVVMSDGRVEQVGSPEEVYNRPVSEFVASFLGNSNILQGRLATLDGSRAEVEVEGLGRFQADASQVAGGSLSEGDRVKLSVRAEKLILTPQDGAEDSSASKLAGEADITRLSGRVTTVDYQGQVARYFLECGQDHGLQAINTIDRAPLETDAQVTITLRARDCVVLPRS